MVMAAGLTEYQENKIIRDCATGNRKRKIPCEFKSLKFIRKE